MYFINVVEIIFSPTGGTEKVAHIIGGHWSKNTVKIDLCDSKIDFTSCNIAKDDMVLIAMPSFGGRAPKPDKDCVRCGLCAEKCPVQAINPTDFRTDSKKCISCVRCVKHCRANARKVNGAMVSIAAMAIRKACSTRKENELFL
ncbi:MAG: 4Fe-4S binding protein [Agathobacter sp.]|nr:4Fe-4S binding protein [Agathobacter sp.]